MVTMKKFMPIRKTVLALHWKHSTLDYLVADRKGDEIRITATGSLECDDDEQTPGEVLRQELQRLKIKRSETLVALSRAQVDVIPLELPLASDDELPIMVANQVARDAGDLAESSVIDFVRLDPTKENVCEVFAFAVDNATLQRVQEECEKASLKPAAILYRPLASVSLLNRMVPRPDRTMMLVTLHGQEVDLSIVRHGNLLFTRTARLMETTKTGDAAGELAVEVRRSLAAASMAADAEEQHLYLFGARDETESLVQDLAEELSLPVTLLDPLRIEHVKVSVPEQASRVAPLLGMVHEHFDQSHPVDFLNPKQPPVPPNMMRKLAGYAAVVAVLLLAGGYYLWGVQNEKKAEVIKLKGDYTKIAKRLARIKQKESVVDAVQAWDADNVNWLDELYDITQRFPAGEDAMVRKITISSGRGGGVVDMPVQVRDKDVVMQLGDNMRAAGHDVTTKRVSEQSSSSDYPWRFDTRITLSRRGADQYRQGLAQNVTKDQPEMTVPVSAEKP